MFDEYVDLINPVNTTQFNNHHEILEKCNYYNFIIDIAIILSSSVLLGGVAYYTYGIFSSFDSNYNPIPDIETGPTPPNSFVVNGIVLTQR